MNVVCCLLMQKGKVLLGKRPLHKANPGHWEFPGGKVEKDESLEEALSRELQEELHIKISAKSFLKIGVMVSPQMSLHLFSADLEQAYQAKEHQAFSWTSWEALQNRLLCPSDKASLKKFRVPIKELFSPNQIKQA